MDKHSTTELKILFLTQYGALAASSRTRVFHYLPYLKKNGHHCATITVLNDASIRSAQILVSRQLWRKLIYYIWAFWRTLICGLRARWYAGRYDLVFLQKVIFPAPLRWLFRSCRTPIVYDFDDAIFTTEVRRQNWLAARKDRRNSIGVPAMLNLASLAIIENEYTANFAARYCAHTAIITGPIDTDRYRPRPSQRATRPEVVLGWIGSSSTLSYLEMLCPALENLGRNFKHVCLHIVGTEAGLKLEHMPVVAKGWSIEEEVEDLRGFDIGLMPMPDDEWTRGKGGYKLLQYMATALPVVASPVGINRQIVTDGQEGFWAESTEQWQEKIGCLIEDVELRRRMGQMGREKMQREYSLDKAQHKLEALLLETAQKEP